LAGQARFDELRRRVAETLGAPPPQPQG